MAQREYRRPDVLTPTDGFSREAELVAMEEDFWVNRVQKKVPPPYIEDDGALILADMGGSRAAVYADGGGSYTVTADPIRRVGILKDDLLRLKESLPDIYDQYVTVSENQKWVFKRSCT